MTVQTVAWADGGAEYRLKAAVLYNFTTFTRWPDLPGDQLDVCVYGDDPFGAQLETIEGKPVGARRIKLRREVGTEQLRSCHVLFIARSAMPRVRAILDVLGDAPVLTVADSDGAIDQDIALNMGVMQGRVIFQANLKAARRVGLNLSAKLLSLAREVRQ